ncbi:MAG: hypothetical protein LBH73_03980, partial [Spirochaetaceae bacterium]|nr:hypothetical protein [Spirochaetaceae bacterium]
TRFVPLSILPEQGLFRESFRILLPFALGAAVAFAFPLFFQGIKLYHRSEMRNEISVTRADFEGHLSFQKDFSYRSLGAPEGQSAYGVYTLDGDGLIGDFTPASGAALPRIDAGDTALFSLLENSSAAAPPELSGLLWVAGLCALLLPSLLLRKKTGDRPGVSARYSDKRIAA